MTTHQPTHLGQRVACVEGGEGGTACKRKQLDLVVACLWRACCGGGGGGGYL